MCIFPSHFLKVAGVYVPVGAGCPAHSGHHQHPAVVTGTVVHSAGKAVCFVLFCQYNLDLVILVQGEE